MAWFRCSGLGWLSADRQGPGLHCDTAPAAGVPEQASAALTAVISEYIGRRRAGSGNAVLAGAVLVDVAIDDLFTSDDEAVAAEAKA
jgi:hypothetical protein